jgi:hypothetical protein
MARWLMNDYLERIREETEADYCKKATIPELTWTEWDKQRKTSVTNPGSLPRFELGNQRIQTHNFELIFQTACNF